MQRIHPFSILLAALCLALIPLVQVHALELVSDINTADRGITVGYGCVLNGTHFFSADDEKNGYELWRSDSPNLDAPQLIFSGFEGPVSGVRYGCVTFGDHIYFVGLSAQRGQVVWKSDGTTAGTTLLVDTHSGNREKIWHIVAGFGKLYFSVIVDDGSSELWVSDGTTQGTRLVQSFFIENGPTSLISGLIAVPGGVIFGGYTSETGREPWFSDGESVTRMIGDLNAGTGSATPVDFTVIGQQVFFSARGIGGSQLYVTSAPYTELTQVLFSKLSTSERPSFNLFDGKVYYQGSDAGGRGLFFTDLAGTTTEKVTLPSEVSAIGAIRKTDTYLIFFVVYNGKAGVMSFHPATQTATFLGTFELLKFRTKQAASLPGHVVFIGNRSDRYAEEFWTTDGTVAGTKKLLESDILLTSSETIRDVHKIGDTAYLNVGQVPIRVDSWRTGGTPESTARISFNPNGATQGANGYPHAKFDQRLIFTGTNNTGQIGAWAYDNNSKALETLFAPELNSQLLNVGIVNGETSRGVFTVQDSDGVFSNYITDGTVDNMPLIVRGETRVHAHQIYRIGDAWLYPCDLGNDLGRELCKSNRNVGGIELLKDIYPGSSSSLPRVLGTFQNRLFFLANDGVNGNELWVSDGTAAGTKLFLDLREGELNYSFISFAALGDRFILATSLGSNDPGFLWVSNGTPAGTTLLYDEGVSLGNRVYLQLMADDHAYFSLENELNEDELWYTDGTRSGTKKVATVKNLRYPLLVDGAAFFVDKQSNRQMLFRYDPECDRLQEVLALDGQELRPILQGDVLILYQRNIFGSVQLYLSDGSAPGTFPLSDVDSVARSFVPTGTLAHIDSTVFVRGSKGGGDLELWMFDTADFGWQGLRVQECSCNVEDTDQDGTLDCSDFCPDDPAKVETGECGCGESEEDANGDLIIDCLEDICPNDPLKTEPGVCGCGVLESDEDGDGIVDSCIANLPPAPIIKVAKRKIRIRIENVPGATYVVTIKKKLRKRKKKSAAKNTTRSKFVIRTKTVHTSKAKLRFKRSLRLRKVSVSYHLEYPGVGATSSLESTVANKRVRKKRR